MKKKILTITLIIVAFIIALQSCKKDKDVILSQNEPNSSQIMLRTDGDSLLQHEIFKFITRMNLVREDPEYVGSEDWNYSRDSTVWYIEAALNYVLTYNYRYYSEEEEESFISILDSTKTEIEGEGGEFNIVDIQETYDYFLDYLSDFYDEIDAEDKFFNLIDIIGIEGYDIKARFVFGTIQAAYNLGDWYWGWNLGGCYFASNLDASDILEADANGLYHMQTAQHLAFSYYTKVNTSDWIWPWDVPVTPHAYGDAMLWEDYQEVTLNHPCLDATEMQVFADFLPTIAATKFNGWDIKSYEVVDGMIHSFTQPPTVVEFWWLVHGTKITYGNQHTGIGSPPTL